MEEGWSLADLGTGSGILALAAKRFGAGRVVGIDIDPKAISVAKVNARLNKIDNVDFKLGDLRKWKSWSREGHCCCEPLQRVVDEIVQTKTQ